MEVIRSPDEMRRWTMQQRLKSRTVGLVPTMGALHEGHLSLVRASSLRCATTVASIFVNPTQFAPHEDLDQYPRTLDRDLEMLDAEGVAAVFVPDNADMYPKEFSTYVEPPSVAKSLEGVFRPTHFRGVTTIVAKLFLAAPVTHAFFGRKDYQQWKVIEAMTRDLNFGIEIVPCEIIRESDGLALSSRNRYLSDTDRQRARLLSKALAEVETAVRRGVRSTKQLESLMTNMLSGNGNAGNGNPGNGNAGNGNAGGGNAGGGNAGNGMADAGQGVDEIEYAVVVDADTLAPIDQIVQTSAALIAARIGTTRLIDNRVIQLPVGMSSSSHQAWQAQQQ